MRIALNYTLFALVATFCNIASQAIFLHFYQGGFAIYLSILVGTAIGLVVKYWLDKRYIFRFVTANARHDSQTFALYTLMGVVTTAIFWGSELAFDALFHSDSLRYLGGILGLAVGYYLKYQLDKRYVFVVRGA